MNADCCVVIPVYKIELNQTEKVAMEGVCKKLPKYDKCFMMPANLDTDYYMETFPAFKRISFDGWNKDSISDYNGLMMDAEFYKHFTGYRYIFVFQPDGLILKDETVLESFIRDDYDYIGAPWPCGYHYRKRVIRGSGHIPFLHKLQGETACYVGNGGVSLRKVDSMVRFWQAWSNEARQWDNAEDIFISFYGQKHRSRLRIAPPEIAAGFSLEINMREEIESGKVPFAVHKWERYYPELPEKEFLCNDYCQNIGRSGQSDVPICNDASAAEQISGHGD